MPGVTAPPPTLAREFRRMLLRLDSATAVAYSSETVFDRYDLTDPVLWELAKIVSEVDLAHDRFDARQAPGLDVLLRGLSMVREGEELFALSVPLFDGLYEYRKPAFPSGREPA
jgi:hypothetical protein